MDRRNFCISLGGLLLVPSAGIVGSVPVIYADGVRDDADALQALIDGKPVRVVGTRGSIFTHNLGGGPVITGCTFAISKMIILRNGVKIHGCTFRYIGPKSETWLAWIGEGCSLTRCLFDCRNAK